MFNIICYVLLCVCGLPTIVRSSLSYTCYPNATFVVVNPNATIFTHVVAFEDVGMDSASPCNVTTSGLLVEITGCQKNHGVTVHFSDRKSSALNDNIFGGHMTKSYRIECKEIPTIRQTVTNILHVYTTPEMTSESLVTTVPTPSIIKPTAEFPATNELQHVSQSSVNSGVTWSVNSVTEFGYAEITQFSAVTSLDNNDSSTNSAVTSSVNDVSNIGSAVTSSVNDVSSTDSGVTSSVNDVSSTDSAVTSSVNDVSRSDSGVTSTDGGLS